ncbi:MAG: helix-turn-helix domain-containing protein [Alicyclobacillus sp.]|nr:helix-turn-helix domain-containing protein [Alicyclobacillus sp.]
MYELLGARVRRFRTERRWSQQELALRSGISTPHISSIERSKRYPSLEYAVRLADALGVPLGALCAETDLQNVPKMRTSPYDLPLHLQNFILNEEATPYLQTAHQISMLPEADREFITLMVDLVVQRRRSAAPATS